MNKSKIDWCDMTWNAVTGCLHGCDYCYARRIAERFGSVRPEDIQEYRNQKVHEVENKKHCPYPFIFEPTFHKYRLDEPKRKRKHQKIFVSSMGDLFGEWVPLDWIKMVLKACVAAPQHTYMFLTKNPKKYGQLNGTLYNYSWDTPSKWWFGITVTCQDDLNRLRHLPYGGAKTFISIEPIKGEIDLSFYLPKQTTRCQCSYCGHYSNYYSSHCQYCGKEGGYSGSFRKQPINWIIIGAQTGPRAVRPKPQWIEKVINQAREAAIPVFLKDNLFWHEKIQEFPEGM